MANKGTRTCKHCGKEYEYCRTFRPTDVFRWQDVACCPEHAALYLEKVQESRQAKADEPKPIQETPNNAVVNTTVIEETPTLVNEISYTEPNCKKKFYKKIINKC